MAATPPPLNFPKSFIAFSKPKQDVWVWLALTMDGQQEKGGRRQGENTAKKNHNVSTSADEKPLKQNRSI